jgi:hypothetical protein
MPLIVVIHIHVDYEACAKSIYMGKTLTRESKLATHDGFIVGDCEAIEGNAYGLIPAYIICTKTGSTKMNPNLRIVYFLMG